MATADKVVGYEFYRGFYADLEKRFVLKDKKQLSTALTLKGFEVLEFFLRNKKKVIARENVQPLDEPAHGRHPIDNYLSKIAGKLGVEKEDLFKVIRGVGYSFEANLREIHASDQQEAGDIFKASELHFNTHTTTMTTVGVSSVIFVPLEVVKQLSATQMMTLAPVSRIACIFRS